MEERSHKDIYDELIDFRARVDTLSDGHKDIYEELMELRSKVDAISSSTKDVVTAFEAAAGAFKVLEWIAKVAKPILTIIASIGAAFLYMKGIK